jgi:hypothetical protein
MAVALGPNGEEALFKEIIGNDWSPLDYVIKAFPWGEKGTPLSNEKGPRKWQLRILRKIEQHIEKNRRAIINGKPTTVYRHAVCSGRGIGKSALVSWLVLWQMSTALGGTVIVTANTEAQLKSRTWAELGKWHTMAINTHWFERDTQSLRPAKWFGQILKDQLKIDTTYYYAQAQLWSEDNPDAFAGAHNPIGMMVLFDEASGIPSTISNVAEGFFTEQSDRRFWFKFSNGRQNTGDFFECFHRYRDDWERDNIDSRTVEGTDTAIFDKIIKNHGEDSDVARVEVRGMFPATGERQLIGRDVIAAAQSRDSVPDDGAPLLMAIDVARYGDDRSVIRFRKGRDARGIPPSTFKGLDVVELANRAAELIDRYRPDAVFVDGNGVGGGVVDVLKHSGYSVIEVQNGGKPNDPDRYLNKRTECWDLLAQWMVIACIDPNDRDLEDDLAAPEYEFNRITNKMQLEPKEVTKSRGLASPDHADALAMTFARTIARKDTSVRVRRRQRVAEGVDFSLLG